MATYAERLVEVEVLQRAPYGLQAYTDEGADVVYVKAQTRIPIAGFIAGQRGDEVWLAWAGGAAQTAYGLA